VSIHPGVTRDEIDRNTGWKVKYCRWMPPPDAGPLSPKN